MKKILSLFLVLTLLLSVCGCSFEIDTTDTRVYPTLAPTVPETTQGPTEPEMLVIPQLVGKHIEELPETDDYKVIVEKKEYSASAAGTILSQEPEGGSWEEKGTTIYVVVSKDQKEGSEIAPLGTEPYEPENPNLPEQTDPPIPEQEYPQDDPPSETVPVQTDPPSTEPELYIDPDGSYTSKNDVALYIYLYGRLPNNFITKNQAESMYGKTSGLNKYGKCIGGDRFYNREGALPGGYTYYECDIDTLYSSKRGAKRLVFTYSGRIYYTDDHYETFTRLY